MEFKSLTGFVMLLILAGMVIGVGTVINDKFGNVVQDLNVYNDSLTFVANHATLDHYPYDKLNSFSNSTHSSLTGVTCVNATGVCTINNGTWKNGAGYAMAYNYYSDSEATDVLQDSSSTIGSIATSWMAVIVIVGVMSIIIGLIVSAFMNRR